MIDSDTPSDLRANVSRADPPTLLEYTWGTDLLRSEPVARDSGTRLTLLHTVDDAGMVPKVAAGWHMCLVVAEHLLDGEPIGPIVGENAPNCGWNALHDAYAEKLGIRDIEQTEGPQQRR
jgi:hypothetical protein